jgi:hypothetical protein
MPAFHVRKQQNAQLLMKALYNRPVISVRAARELLRVQPNITNSLIQEFVEHDVLKEITGNKRNRLFFYSRYLSIFE